MTTSTVQHEPAEGHAVGHPGHGGPKAHALDDAADPDALGVHGASFHSTTR